MVRHTASFLSISDASLFAHTNKNSEKDLRKEVIKRKTVEKFLKHDVRGRQKETEAYL
ncbi:MAG: hypothetical protein P4M12_06650 [Gammaproteobacteria bacterium]|nr:hypothetical protein [Gammaproteobacteria bacterium]